MFTKRLCTIDVSIRRTDAVYIHVLSSFNLYRELLCIECLPKVHGYQPIRMKVRSKIYAALLHNRVPARKETQSQTDTRETSQRDGKGRPEVRNRPDEGQDEPDVRHDRDDGMAPRERPYHGLQRNQSSSISVRGIWCLRAGLERVASALHVPERLDLVDADEGAEVSRRNMHWANGS